jgi:hypothetical protein
LPGAEADGWDLGASVEGEVRGKHVGWWCCVLVVWNVRTIF